MVRHAELARPYYVCGLRFLGRFNGAKVAVSACRAVLCSKFGLDIAHIETTGRARLALLGVKPHDGLNSGLLTLLRAGLVLLQRASCETLRAKAVI